jgi:hypothetical protein
MRTVVTRFIAIAVGVWITTMAAACSPIQVVTSPLVTGSQWQVVSVDDESTLGLELILTFIGDSATLSSRCGASSGDVVIDPTGHAVAFGPLEGPAGEPICPDTALELHQRVAAALQGVDRWESAGSATELHGDRIIRLRPQATDT